MDPEPELVVKYGCLVDKQVYGDSGLTYVEHASTRKYATFETRLERPQRGQEVTEVVCGLCGARLQVIVRSRTSVIGRLSASWLLYFVIPNVAALALYCLSNDLALLAAAIAVVSACGSLVLLSHTVLYLIDHWQGNATAAVEWSKKGREIDYDSGQHDFKHEFLSVRRIVGITA